MATFVGNSATFALIGTGYSERQQLNVTAYINQVVANNVAIIGLPSGPTGPSGTTGWSGPSGPTGTTGYTGSSGPTGYTGPTGWTGYSGFTGPQGLPGSNAGVLYFYQNTGSGVTGAPNVPDSSAAPFINPAGPSSYLSLFQGIAFTGTAIES